MSVIVIVDDAREMFDRLESDPAISEETKQLFYDLLDMSRGGIISSLRLDNAAKAAREGQLEDTITSLLLR